MPSCTDDLQHIPLVNVGNECQGLDGQLVDNAGS